MTEAEKPRCGSTDTKTGKPCRRLDASCIHHNGKLKGKRKDKRKKLFADGLLQGKNTVQAARDAGYSETTAKTHAYSWREDPYVKGRIDAQLKASQLETDEIIGTAVQHMRGDIASMFDENGRFSWEMAVSNGVTHLIKSITRTPTKYGETVRVELYDAGRAVESLARIFGLEKLPARNPADEQFMRDELRKSIDAIIAADGVDEQTAKLKLAGQLKDDPVWQSYVSELVQ